MKLLVVTGHGAGDSGAVGYGFTEAERVRALANRIKALGGNSVILGDQSINWYRSNTFSSVAKNFDCAIELHMDSASAAARGGHVIINGNFAADQYDNALTNFIGGFFPGRSKTIVGRNDLANVNRTAARGINYRLLEVCFISNQEDLTKFNNNLDAIAKGILAAFGIGANASAPAPAPSKPTPAPSKPSGGQSIAQVAKDVINGKYGNGSDRKANVERAGYNYAQVQAEVNRQLGGGSAPAKPQASNLDAVARAVIAGNYGNGAARKANVERAGYSYAEVQKRVNAILGGGSSTSAGKSLDTIAKEVIAGKWGNGADRANRLARAGYNAKEVQKRVNQLL